MQQKGLLKRKTVFFSVQNRLFSQDTLNKTLGLSENCSDSFTFKRKTHNDSSFLP